MSCGTWRTWRCLARIFKAATIRRCRSRPVGPSKLNLSFSVPYAYLCAAQARIGKLDDARHTVQRMLEIDSLLLHLALS